MKRNQIDGEKSCHEILRIIINSRRFLMYKFEIRRIPEPLFTQEMHLPNWKIHNFPCLFKGLSIKILTHFYLIAQCILQVIKIIARNKEFFVWLA